MSNTRTEKTLLRTGVLNNAVNMGVLRLPVVTQVVGLSRSTIYLLIQKNAFPRPIKLSERAVGWKQSDIDAWLESRAIAGAQE